MSKQEKTKIIAIVGTTSSGKTGLAVRLCDLFDGEVISADSRQVYEYMDIGSGKDLKEYDIIDSEGKTKHIPYHLIDVCHPRERYDLAQWLRDAKNAISDISARGKTAVLAGGTGLYAQALLDGYKLSEAKTDTDLRAELEELDCEELLERLSELNKMFVQRLNESERKNKRRLIRYIEINSTGKNQSSISKDKPYDSLIISFDWPRDILRQRIRQRLKDRLEKEGMINEVKMLREEQGLSWERLESFGLEYRYISRHLRGLLSYEEMQEKLALAIGQFAKRQITWLRRWEKQGAKIHWIHEHDEAIELCREFLCK